MTDPAPAPPYRLPSLARRLTIASLLLIPLLVLLVGLPYALLTYVNSLGVTSSIGVASVTIGGAVLAILRAARPVARPTRAFGPIATIGSVAAVLYLVLLSPLASFSVPFGSGSGVTLSYGRILLALAIAPVIAAVAGVLTTVEDARAPGERLPYDFPS